MDRSHWGRLRLAGDDRLSFLHGQSTNDIQALQPGAGCDTVFVTAQARTIDLATVLAQGSGAMVLVSPDTKQTLLERLDKHIFPGDKVCGAGWACLHVFWGLHVHRHLSWGASWQQGCTE